MKIFKLTILLLTIILLSCTNKETTENKNALLDNNNDNIDIELNDPFDFILSTEGTIKYLNRDTLILYKSNSKDSESIIIDHKDVFLTKVEETPGWYYLVAKYREIEGYIYIYDISKKSFYGEVETDEESRNYRFHIVKEYNLINQYENINRYGPLITINHHGKVLEYIDTFDGFFGYFYRFIEYYPEINELLIEKASLAGVFNFIYNLEYSEYRCENIYMPYFNNTRTYMISMRYSDSLSEAKAYELKIFKINNGFYEEIYNEQVNIHDTWSLNYIRWINNNEVQLNYGEAGILTFKIDNKVTISSSLIKIPGWWGNEQF